MNLQEQIYRIKSVMGIIVEQRGGHNKDSRDEFIMKAGEVKKNQTSSGTPKYSYTLVNLEDNDPKIKVICPKHKDEQMKLTGTKYFEVFPNKHLQGQGCRFCYIESKQKHPDKELEDVAKNFTSTNEFKKMANSEYNAALKRDKKIPGFFDKITSHFTPHLSESVGEKIVAKILINNGFISEKCLENKCEERQKTFQGCTNKKEGRHCRPLWFDFYIPSLNTVVEYDGDQHFIPSRQYGDKKYESTVENDLLKNAYCKEKGIKMIRIPYNLRGELIESELINALDSKEPFQLLGNYPTKGWNAKQ